MDVDKPRGTGSAAEQAARIRALNDRFRSSMLGGHVVVTRAAWSQSPETRLRLLQAVTDFDAFNAGNDPHNEHDFGAFTCSGVSYIWKIDYYDRARRFASPDPSNAAITVRVLTIMCANEY